MMTVMEGFVAAPAGGGGSRLIYLVPWNRGLKRDSGTQKRTKEGLHIWLNKDWKKQKKD